jgi:hypothetical protein
MVPLVKGMEAEEVSYRTGGGGCALALSRDGGGNIGEVVDGVGQNADGLG